MTNEKGTQSANNKRSSKISFLKRRNHNLYKDLITFIEKTDLKREKKDLLWKYAEQINKCSSKSLYELGENNRYIASHTCKNKTCFVCNYQKLKSIRKKYKDFFDNNIKVFQVQKPLKNRKFNKKYVVQSNLDSYINKGFVQTAELKYNLMHLTLTVPHTVDGWRGTKYYFKEFISCLKELFKHEDLEKYILGGEFGVEVTNQDGRTETIRGQVKERPTAGLHIHAHCMILVRRFFKNRDITHKTILKVWNKLTADSRSNRKTFEPAQIEAIKKGNSLITDEFIQELDPTGATMIGLSNIYYHDENGKKKYIDSLDIDNKNEMTTKAILETIKYHFEPLAFDKKNDEFDYELLINTVLEIRGIKLHEKFGCLYGCKELNQNTEIKEDFNENKNNEEAAGTRDHVITNSLYVIHDWKNDNKIIFPPYLLTSQKTVILKNVTTTQAVNLFIETKLTSFGKRPDKKECV